MSKQIQFTPVDNNEEHAIIGNAIQTFRDGFVTAAPDTDSWYEEWLNKGSGIVTKGGNAAGSSFLRISLDPYQDASEYRLTSKDKFNFPLYFLFGMSLSQRIVGQEVFVGLVGCDTSGAVEYSDFVPDIAISGTVTISSNVATINTAAPHGLNGGDRVTIFGNDECRLNVGPVVVTVVSSTSFTVPCTLANGTYAAGGFLSFAEPNRYANNYVGLLTENATATNASFVARRNAAKFRTSNATIPTTVASQGNTSPYTDSFNAAGMHELHAKVSEMIYVGRTADGVTVPSGQARYTQGIPDESRDYRIQVRVRNLRGMTKIVGDIVSANKSGSTTATIVTDRPHGLVTGQFVQIYGIRDTTNFANVTTAVAVTVIDPTTFTLVIAVSATAASAGGIVVLNQGSVTLPGAISLAVQSIARTNNILTVTMNTTASGLLPGEYAQLGGLDGAAAGYNGPYKLLRMTGSTYEFESFGDDFTSINCGGAVVKRTDVRVHFAAMIDATRLTVEMAQANGLSDGNKAIPARIMDGTISTVTAITGGNVAHDAVDAGNSHKIGGIARTADPTPVSAGNDRADAYFDTLGKIVTTPLSPRALVLQGNVTLTSTTETTVISAGGASIFADISTIIVANTSATGVRVDFRDATAGTVRHSVWVPANNTIECNFDDVPLKQTTAANGPWTAQLSAAVTDVRITMVGPGRKA